MNPTPKLVVFSFISMLLLVMSYGSVSKIQDNGSCEEFVGTWDINYVYGEPTIIELELRGDSLFGMFARTLSPPIVLKGSCNNEGRIVLTSEESQGIVIKSLDGVEHRHSTGMKLTAYMAEDGKSIIGTEEYIDTETSQAVIRKPFEASRKKNEDR